MIVIGKKAKNGGAAEKLKLGEKMNDRSTAM